MLSCPRLDTAAYNADIRVSAGLGDHVLLGPLELDRCRGRGGTLD